MFDTRDLIKVNDIIKSCTRKSHLKAAAIIAQNYLKRIEPKGKFFGLWPADWGNYYDVRQAINKDITAKNKEVW
jgi:hypothetical protein